MANSHRKLLLWGGLFAFLFLSIYCQTDKPVVSKPVTYVGLEDTVSYVGMQECVACHKAVYDSYIHTGMGQSFDLATKAKSAAKFDEHALVYDPNSNFYYRPFWRGDSLMVLEFRLEGKDTIHKREERINYIVGSGQHTNSHITNDHGFLFQVPITFYTQQGKWDMAPGFEGGFNSRFSRTIELECVTCHNHYPDFVEGSRNRYRRVPTGIECERCHGPGEVHVREKLAGKFVDTAKAIDYSIVNPAKLPVDLQMSLCQRCHLQGVAVLKEGKRFMDFKPGMHLNEVMDVFLPQYSGDDAQFIMASQADRLRKSNCFQQSNNISCITCHNPHKSVKVTTKEHFDRKCQSCHHQDGQLTCTETEAKRKVVQDNCTHCHMPKSGSIDIPHVSITDHYIRKPVEEAEQDAVKTFVRLACRTSEEVDPLTMAKGYLAYQEKFSRQHGLLDSAQYYLTKAGKTGRTVPFYKAKIHLHYLKGEYQQVVQAQQAAEHQNLSMQDGWTNYRVGEAYYQLGDLSHAQHYYQLALDIDPFVPEFGNKLGSVLVALNKIAEAKMVFAKVIELDPKFVPALSNYGYVLLKQGDQNGAANYYQRALALDPDYVQGLLNMAGIHLLRLENTQARQLLQRVLRIEPTNEKAKYILKQIG